MIEPSDGPRVDPTVLRAIRSFDPGVIPFWRKQHWLLPDKTRRIVASHLCIGRHVRNPHRTLPPFRVETPVGFRGVVPNEIELILENKFGTGHFDNGGPGSPAVFSMGLYHQLRDMFNEMEPGEKYFTRLETRKKERLERARASDRAEKDYRGSHLEPWSNRQLEKASPTEFKEYQARKRAGRPRRPFIALSSVRSQ